MMTVEMACDTLQPIVLSHHDDIKTWRTENTELIKHDWRAGEWCHFGEGELEMRISRKLALLLLPSMLIGCGTAIFKHKPGTTYGEIFVGPPRVTGRERLVNDRLVEDLWLKEQLDNSDSKAFGFSGFADLRSSSRRSFSANLQARSEEHTSELQSL